MTEEQCKDRRPELEDAEESSDKEVPAVDEFFPGADLSYNEGAVLEYGDGLSQEEARSLSHLLRSNKSVKKLSMTGVSLSALRAAFDKLEDWGSLEELELFYVECEGEDFSIDLSGAFRKLRTIDLRCDNVSGAFAQNIAGYLRESKSLQELSLWGSCGGDEGVLAIADALTMNDTLKKLRVVGEKLSSQTLVAFAKTLAVNSTLELVDLFDTCSTEKDQVTLLSQQDGCLFERLYILWSEELLPLVTRLVREGRHGPDLSVSVTASVDKDILREFFDAVAANTTLRLLHFYPSDECFDELADGIASVVKRTTTLKEVQNLMHVAEGREQQLVRVLDALRENRSVTCFSMYVELLRVDAATALSRLLKANDTLTSVSVCEYWGITSDIVGIILEGLRQNNTVTSLMVSWDPDDDVAGIAEMEQLLKRNACLLEQPGECVNCDCADPEAGNV